MKNLKQLIEKAKKMTSWSNGHLKQIQRVYSHYSVGELNRLCDAFDTAVANGLEKEVKSRLDRRDLLVGAY